MQHQRCCCTRAARRPPPRRRRRMPSSARRSTRSSLPVSPALLLVRDGDHTVRHASGYGNLAGERGCASPTASGSAARQRCSSRPSSSSSSARGNSRRHRRAQAARADPERERHHRPPAPQPHKRPLRLRRGQCLPRPARQPPQGLGAAPADRPRNRAQAGLPARPSGATQHRLHRARTHGRGRNRKHPRSRAARTDLRAPPATRHQLRHATDRGPLRPHGYSRLRKPRLYDASFVDPSLFWAAGAIVSTVDDLARFHDALLRGRLLAPFARP